MDNTTVAVMRAALANIARVVLDGEMLEGVPYEMSIDDAFETLNSVVMLARHALPKEG
jgi:hypothetical protein